MPDQLAPYWYSRLIFERGLALIYLIAFLVVVNQFIPLLGERGLLPVPRFVQAVPFRESPSLFYLRATDGVFRAAGWLGVLLSILALTGWCSTAARWRRAYVWGLLWILYLSFVNVGQTFYGFGWESLLLEVGFFTIFAGAGTASPPTIAELDLPVDAVSTDVRCRADQDSGRFVLARPDVPRLLTSRPSRFPTRSAGTFTGCHGRCSTAASPSITSSS